MGIAIGVGLLAHFGLPEIDAALARNGLMPSPTSALRFADLYPLFVTFVGHWQGALMPGVVFAFLLLDEKEDRTLLAMRVTPVPFLHYIGYRVALPTLLAFGFSLVLIPIIGFNAVPGWQLVILALGSCLTAPLVTLLIAHYANDKVQGFALNKFGGVAGLIILFGWFVPEPWQWLLCVFPPFLIAKAYWLAGSGDPTWWVAWGLGVVAQLGLLRWMVRRFRG